MFGVGGGKCGVSQTAPATILSPQATQGAKLIILIVRVV